MIAYYNSKASRLRFAAPHTLLGVGGVASALLGLLLFILGWVVLQVPANYFISSATLGGFACNLVEAGSCLIGFACLLFLASYFLYKFIPDYEKIRHMVYRGLCCPAYGNPLRLKDGEFLPKVSCVPSNAGRYKITVTGASIAIEDVVKSASRISGLINGKYQRYAIIYAENSPDCQLLPALVPGILVFQERLCHVGVKVHAVCVDLFGYLGVIGIDHVHGHPKGQKRRN